MGYLQELYAGEINKYNYFASSRNGPKKFDFSLHEDSGGLMHTTLVHHLVPPVSLAIKWGKSPPSNKCCLALVVKLTNLATEILLFIDKHYSHFSLWKRNSENKMK